MYKIRTLLYVVELGLKYFQFCCGERGGLFPVPLKFDENLSRKSTYKVDTLK